MNNLNFFSGSVVSGNAIAFFLRFLAPTSAFKRMVMKNKLTEEFFSSIPYLTTLLNCLLSAARYGLPLVSANSILVSTINTMGAALESIYLFIFFIFAPKTEKDKIVELLSFALSFKQPSSQPNK